MTSRISAPPHWLDPCFVTGASLYSPSRSFNTDTSPPLKIRHQVILGRGYLETLCPIFKVGEGGPPASRFLDTPLMIRNFDAASLVAWERLGVEM